MKKLGLVLVFFLSINVNAVWQVQGTFRCSFSKNRVSVADKSISLKEDEIDSVIRNRQEIKVENQGHYCSARLEVQYDRKNPNKVRVSVPNITLGILQENGALKEIQTIAQDRADGKYTNFLVIETREPVLGGHKSFGCRCEADFYGPGLH